MSTTDSANKHQHGLSATDIRFQSQADRMTAIEARVKALEAPVVVPPPVVVPLPPATVPFLSRPASAAIVRSGGSDVLIENVTIRGASPTAPSGIGISLSGAHNVTIRNVDLADLVGGIYLYGLTGTLIVENVRSRNIGDGTIGAGHSNHMQLAECSVTGHVSGCNLLGGRTEDMLSIWHSGGLAGSPLVIENNHLQGVTVDSATVRRWTSSSGTGIIVGDGGGSAKNGNVIVRNNTLLNPGQVGIQIIDGPALSIHDNIITAVPYANNNNPMTTWEGQPAGEAFANRYNWTNANGSHPSPWLYGGGTITFHDNVNDPTLVPADYAVVL